MRTKVDLKTKKAKVIHEKRNKKTRRNKSMVKTKIIKEQEKIIDLMAEYIQALISKYEDDTYTYTSIIDYFKKKAKGE